MSCSTTRTLLRGEKLRTPGNDVEVLVHTVNPYAARNSEGKEKRTAINYAEGESWLEYQYFITGTTRYIGTEANICLLQGEEHPV